MKILFSISLIFFTALACQTEVSNNKVSTQSDQEVIIDKFLKNGAWNYHYLTKEWGEWIDKGIKEDSTIAILWQQKALPFWKQKKYQLATSYYEKAVKYDRALWLSRLGFL